MNYSRTLAPLCLAAVLTSASTAGAADAGGLFDSHFTKIAGGTPCYARTYDDAHLKDHPKQQVKRIEFGMSKTNPDGVANTPENFELGFGVQVTRSPEWYTGVAICKEGGDTVDCFLEGDGGRFRLTADKDGALKLETGDYGLAFEGARDTLELSDKTGDDKVFILTPSAHAECEAATVEVKPPEE